MVWKGLYGSGAKDGQVEDEESRSKLLDCVEPYGELLASFTGDYFDHCSKALNVSFTMFYFFGGCL